MKTKTALVELLKENRDCRKLFKACCFTSAYRLRAQAWQFREELASRGHFIPLDEVQDSLFELARDLFPSSPGAVFSDHAEIIFRDALSRMQEHFTNLTDEEKDAADLSRAWEWGESATVAARNEDLAAFKGAIEQYEREALEALEETKKASGAA